MGKSVLHAVAHGIGKSSERKRMVKLCIRKLQNIDDPETFLCRSVLINNTLKNLQIIQKEAKLRKMRESLEANPLLETEDNLKSIDQAESEYSTEEILNDIDMPAPLSPTLEDIVPDTFPSNINIVHDQLHLTPVLAPIHSDSSNGWIDREDWEQEQGSWDKWEHQDSILWERGSKELTATLDLTLLKKTGSEEEGSDSSGSLSGEEGSTEDGCSSEGEMYDREISCGHSYISEKSVPTLSVINSLIASLES